MADMFRKAIMLKLLLGTAFVILLVAVIVQGMMLSRQGRRLSALEEQARDLQRQSLRMADAIFGSRGPARSLGEVARDVDAVRRDMAEAREALRRTR
jgi:hypothetical protein